MGKNYQYDGSVADIYVANLGKYNEGVLQGGWISLPYESEEVFEEFLEEVVGINEEYEEYAIHDYESDFFHIDEYNNIEMLNEQAEEIDGMDEWDRRKLLAAVEIYGNEAFEYDIDDFTLLENVNDNYDLGYYYAHEMCDIFYGNKNETLERYFDYEAFGRDIELEAQGGFTSFGFLELLG